MLETGILATYLAIILAVGIWKGREEKTESDYLVGGRNIPWWAVLGSLVATEVSAATFLAVPSVGFSENMTYLQFGIGSILARIFVATVFIKAFYAADCYSIYEYLGKRFGDRSQFTASIYFIVTRLMASGVRLMIAATGFAVITGWHYGVCLFLFGIMTLAYTMVGGIKAVIWTDCVQAVVFLSAGFAAVFYLIDVNGWEPLRHLGQEAGRWEIFRFTPGEGISWWNDSKWFWTAVLFGFASTAAAMGTDQDMAQRLLSSRTAGYARRSLILSGFIALPVAGLFLTVGVLLWGHYQLNPGSDFALKMLDGAVEPDPDEAFSSFIASGIPTLLKGLLLTGVMAAAMSSLDSAMAALSSSALRDLTFRRRRETVVDNGSGLKNSRLYTFFFAIILMLIAWFMRDGGTFLWLAFKVTSLTYGSLLGIFLLGMLSNAKSDLFNMYGMIAATILSSSLLYLIETKRLDLAWTYLIVIGALVTFLAGYLGDKFENRRGQ